MGGEVKVAGKRRPVPLLNPGMVAVAMSGPTGRPPLVARRERVRFGKEPLQLYTQNRLRSARSSRPLRPAVNVWPPHFAVVMPTAPVLTVAFAWSTRAGLSRIALPGLVRRSRLVNPPVRKSAREVVKKQALEGDTSRGTSLVVAAPSATTTAVSEVEV